MLLGTVLTLLSPADKSVLMAIQFSFSLTFLPLAYWIVFETPVNLLIPYTLYGIVYALLHALNKTLAKVVVFPLKLAIECLYLFFIWPVWLLDMAAGLFIKRKRYSVGRWALLLSGVPVSQWNSRSGSKKKIFPLMRMKDEVLFGIYNFLKI
ncbi:hypothetical protein JW948_15700 [bacterium]|nr:hypothetical protein [bacterium]